MMTTPVRGAGGTHVEHEKKPMSKWHRRIKLLVQLIALILLIGKMSPALHKNPGFRNVANQMLQGPQALVNTVVNAAAARREGGEISLNISPPAIKGHKDPGDVLVVTPRNRLDMERLRVGDTIEWDVEPSPYVVGSEGEPTIPPQTRLISRVTARDDNPAYPRLFHQFETVRFPNGAEAPISGSACDPEAQSEPDFTMSEFSSIGICIGFVAGSTEAIVIGWLVGEGLENYLKRNESRPVSYMDASLSRDYRVGIRLKQPLEWNLVSASGSPDVKQTASKQAEVMETEVKRTARRTRKTKIRNADRGDD